MKREILFRGWTIGEFSWEYGFLSWVDTPRGRGYFINNKRVDERTVGQYTGMTDKNGTKIFEGDVIKEKFKNHENIYLIFWDEETCCFWSGNGDTFYGYSFNELHFDNSVVIGNIHDNTELLNRFKHEHKQTI